MIGAVRITSSRVRSRKRNRPIFERRCWRSSSPASSARFCSNSSRLLWYSSSTSSCRAPIRRSSSSIDSFILPSSAIAQIGFARRPPGGFVGGGEGVELGRGAGRVIDPFAEQRRAVDQVDRQPLELVFVAEVAPDRVIRVKPADRLEGQRLQAPGLEGGG